MGICLSCLRGIDDDDQSQLNENTPLLNDQPDYDQASVLRKREEELNTIVDETNENLIDITTFFNTSNSIQDLSLKKSVATLKSEITTHNEVDSEPYKSRAKLIANEYISAEDKSTLLDLNKTLFDLVDKATKIENRGPLVASFD